MSEAEKQEAVLLGEQTMVTERQSEEVRPSVLAGGVNTAPLVLTPPAVAPTIPYYAR